MWCRCVRNWRNYWPCVVFTKYLRPVQVFGKNHTCVVFTKHLRLFQMFGKNHTCVWKTKQACVFPNTGWYFLYLYLNLTNITQISYLIYILVIQDAQTQSCNIGKIRKTALYFTCVGIPTHIKQQNSNNNIKKITFDMCAPPRFCTQLWALQRYFCLFVILRGLESTTLKPIYWFWANGDDLEADREQVKDPHLGAHQFQRSRCGCS